MEKIIKSKTEMIEDHDEAIREAIWILNHTYFIRYMAEQPLTIP